MKKILFELFLIVFVLLYQSSNVFSEVSFAILPVEYKATGEEAEKDKNQYMKSAEDGLHQTLIESGRFIIADRTRIKQVLEEKAFKTAYLKDPEKASEIGKIIGVEKFIVSTIYDAGYAKLGIDFEVVDVETSQVELSKKGSEWIRSINVKYLARLFAVEIIEKYPLTGKVLKKDGEVVTVNFGRSNRLDIGDHLFVVRKEALTSDEGEVLFEKNKPIGVLEVISVDAAQSKAKTKRLEDPDNPVKKDDLVSPDPIVKKEPIISEKPLLPNVGKGKLILDDNMQETQYFAINYISINYKDGKLYLQGSTGYRSGVHEAGTCCIGLMARDTHALKYPAFCFYPKPYDMLENFIIEGEVEFQKVWMGLNSFIIVFRKKGSYIDENIHCYMFYWDDKGRYSFYKYGFGKRYIIIPGEFSSVIRQGVSKNRFRIVAKDSKFDFYINGKFVVGIEDECVARGSIGFFMPYASHCAVDNIKIWEAVKE